MQTLKQKLAAGQRVLTFALGRAQHYNVVLMFGTAGGFDGFWIDAEHSGFSTSEMEVAAIAGRSVGLDSFVRIPPTDYSLVTRCLESGPTGVMAAMIQSAAQAEEFVRWSKYAPRGTRGLNTGSIEGHFGTIPAGEYVQKANRESFVAIQIETLGALEEVDAIAAIDGVDHLFVGPSDLSQALGVTGDFLNPKCAAAVDKVAAACRNHNKSWGAVVMTPDHAAMYAEKGCQLFSITNDVRVVNAGIRAIKSTFADLLG